jgi:urease accessory protein
MSAGVCPSSAASRDVSGARALAARALGPIRQIGGTSIELVERGGATRVRDAVESGGYRVRLPLAEHGMEAALINTGGGLAGGDRVEHVVHAGPGTRALITTPAAERIYRTLGPSAEARVTLSVGAGARLAWLPQETILFDGAALERRIEADVEPAASLLLLEMTVLGREARGEIVTQGRLRDTWRIRRGGRFVYADNLRLDGDIAALMQRQAIGDGARVLAAMLYVGPDASDHLQAVRAALAPIGDRAGASSWNGLLVVRLLGATRSETRAAIARIVPLLARRPMPRLWWT